MYFDENFRKIGQVSVTDIKRIVESLSDEQWSRHEGRQNTYKVHSSTQTIPLIFDADFRHRFPTMHADFNLLSESLQPAMEVINEYFKKHLEKQSSIRKIRLEKSYFIRTILVRLAPGSTISTHTDHGYSLCRAHRIHWPIISSDNVQFSINDEINTLPAGELWEVNNRRPHSVINAGSAYRVHLIFDFVIPNEVIEDPIAGTLFA
jgi:hypothetical protein